MSKMQGKLVGYLLNQFHSLSDLFRRCKMHESKILITITNCSNYEKCMRRFLTASAGRDVVNSRILWIKSIAKNKTSVYA